MPNTTKSHYDEFELYDLRIETMPLADGAKMACNHPVGSYFELSGENLKLGQPTFPIYPLAAILPLLPAKQRVLNPNDWMASDAIIACPDPLCGGRFKISRIGKTIFRHSETTLNKMGKDKENATD